MEKSTFLLPLPFRTQHFLIIMWPSQVAFFLSLFHSHTHKCRREKSLKHSRNERKKMLFLPALQIAHTKQSFRACCPFSACCEALRRSSSSIMYAFAFKSPPLNPYQKLLNEFCFSSALLRRGEWVNAIPKVFSLHLAIVMSRWNFLSLRDLRILREVVNEELQILGEKVEYCKRIDVVMVGENFSVSLFNSNVECAFYEPREYLHNFLRFRHFSSIIQAQLGNDSKERAEFTAAESFNGSSPNIGALHGFVRVYGAKWCFGCITYKPPRNVSRNENLSSTSQSRQPMPKCVY